MPLIVYFCTPPAVMTCAAAEGNVLETLVMKSFAAIIGFGSFAGVDGGAELPGVEGSDDEVC